MKQRVYIRRAFLDPSDPKLQENRQKREKELSRMGRELILAMLWELLGIRAELTDFGTGSKGKPYLIPYPEVHFNISHSGTLVMAALSDAPVGLDIERIRIDGRMDLSRLARRSFPDSFLRRMEEAEHPEQAFFWLWTELEAYGKYLGTGLPAVIKAEPEAGYQTQIAVPEGYAGSLCTESQAEVIQYTEIVERS